ncbi:eight-cysteine-cluster domain-containing protein, partial [Candidatus Woesearchaeota archaeon]|nr:eight-cysteine-cluster domain-containing protein [Candidatus Woesearchaeota archaeon]
APARPVPHGQRDGIHDPPVPGGSSSLALRLGARSAHCPPAPAGPPILGIWQEVRPIANRLTIRAVHAKTYGLVMRMQHLQYQLECSLDSIDDPEAGEALEQQIAQFREQIAAAETYSESAKQHIADAKQLQYNGEVSQANAKLVEANREVQLAKRALLQAHNKLKEIVKSYREGGGKITACEDGDEVQQEEEVLVEFCGSSTLGSCAADGDCIESGCSGQVCQSKSEEIVVTTCEYIECYNAESYNLSCICVESECKWA